MPVRPVTRTRPAARTYLGHSQRTLGVFKAAEATYAIPDRGGVLARVSCGTVAGWPLLDVRARCAAWDLRPERF
jgi:hypothetical protein